MSTINPVDVWLQQGKDLVVWWNGRLNHSKPHPPHNAATETHYNRRKERQSRRCAQVTIRVTIQSDDTSVAAIRCSQGGVASVQSPSLSPTFLCRHNQYSHHQSITIAIILPSAAILAITLTKKSTTPTFVQNRGAEYQLRPPNPQSSYALLRLVNAPSTQCKQIHVTRVGRTAQVLPHWSTSTLPRLTQ
ncbi:hypothetical protein V495_05016 [Pseudogymnoascus sp. VKM F-4514 (FW-929)]|nr:hypothetical protein V495_05016 [Pseudogymnoascus sp. VKM F-4514 (FW-929)]KFY62370.1 hypothetical protein V497_02408 [Pseudogymnoascus sp. VKM F-4516 (FW-969)]